MSKRAAPRRRDKPGNKSIHTSVPARTQVPPISDGVNARLARLLDTPHLARVVPHIAPEVLHHLIRECGLEACGPVIAATTPKQLASVLDLDLWHATPGRDDQFDPHRFGTWLEALINEGEAVAAGVVAAMDQELVVAGLSHYVRVFDPGVFEPTFSSDDERPDVRSGHVESEVGGYVVRAKTAHAWDAIVGLFVALSDDRPECFHALMQGCQRVSKSAPEIDGLDDLMLEPEQQLHDVSIVREQRRTQQGYLTAGDARAFLKMARQPRSASSSNNGIATAYFRALDTDMASSDETSQPDESSERSPSDREVSNSIDAITELLTQSGARAPRALLGPAGGQVSRVTPLEPLMEYVHDTDQMAYFARNRELAFLSNALVAGCSVYSRPLTVQEAWSAAVGVCNLGLEVLSQASVDPTGAPDTAATLPQDFLIDHDVLAAFDAGWKLLHDDVSMFVTERLISILEDFHTVDSVVQRDLYQLRRKLERNRDARTPWLTQDTLEVLAIIDTPAWASLCGLLSECPVLPATMNAILDKHAGSVSATAFESFATRQQIRRVHEFVARLREILTD